MPKNKLGASHDNAGSYQKTAILESLSIHKKVFTVLSMMDISGVAMKEHLYLPLPNATSSTIDCESGYFSVFQVHFVRDLLPNVFVVFL